MRQEALHVLALSVPADEAVHRERVPEVVEARTEGAARWALKAGLLPHPLEDEFGGLTQNGPTLTIGEEWIVSRSRSPPVLLITIALEAAHEVDADRDQSTLVELCLADCQHGLGQVDVCRLERQRLADTEPRGVEEQ